MTSTTIPAMISEGPMQQVKMISAEKKERKKKKKKKKKKKDFF